MTDTTSSSHANSPVRANTNTMDEQTCANALKRLRALFSKGVDPRLDAVLEEADVVLAQHTASEAGQQPQERTLPTFPARLATVDVVIDGKIVSAEPAGDYFAHSGVVAYARAALDYSNVGGVPEPDIDTSDFMELLNKFAHESSCEQFDEAAYNAARQGVIDHIKAHYLVGAGTAQVQLVRAYVLEEAANVCRGYAGRIVDPFGRDAAMDCSDAILALKNQASSTQPVQGEHFAWAAFAENGNVIIWSRQRSVVEPVAAKYGRPVVPVVYLAVSPQADPAK